MAPVFLPGKKLEIKKLGRQMSIFCCCQYTTQKTWCPMLCAIQCVETVVVYLWLFDGKKNPETKPKVWHLLSLILLSSSKRDKLTCLNISNLAQFFVDILYPLPCRIHSSFIYKHQASKSRKFKHFISICQG